MSKQNETPTATATAVANGTATIDDVVDDLLGQLFAQDDLGDVQIADVEEDELQELLGLRKKVA